ncbi:ligand-binding sensor domain-containing protein [Mariniphaga anaerophila]|uniref:Ligand-binding sensor domain-containing protein n=1 Tax=Mariniphaga anaerophila TaxID=1484053 RepID=A0A1M4YTC7_9BACT|nr:triple tyrosine motif-containing protein [Mariniphaga anaerophila]SHF09099.1 ligand-binding sensor domain-containing protein [Mariniphaga anaerophila]
MQRTLITFFLFFPFLCFAGVKDIGTPRIYNYTKSEYNAGTQNWSITQDSRGFMYFANNDGILRFDGVSWNLIPVSPVSPVRSVFCDSKNNLYVGTINDFGVLEREDPRASRFVSLKNLLPADIQNFDDIWQIHETTDGIVFQCYKYLFVYNGRQINVIAAQNSFYNSFKVGETLFVQDNEVGFFELQGQNLVQSLDLKEITRRDIRAVLRADTGKLLIGTETEGLFFADEKGIRQWKSPVNEFVIKNRLYCATALSGDYYAFGTILNGVVISDKNGNVVKALNTHRGIQNNTVLSCFVDRDEDLWLGLDNGIDLVELSLPLSFIGGRNIGSGYTCRVFNGNLYLGTNQGLYVSPLSGNNENPSFELVKNTAGQVWSLDVFDNQLICGHNQGTFNVEGNSAFKISEKEGAWKYIELNNKKEYLLGGHYQGLVLLKKENGGWKYVKAVKGFDESSRYLYQDEQGYIWIGHGGKGIYRLALNENLDSVSVLQHYTTKQGLPSDAGNILLRLNKKLYVSTDKGIYKFDYETNNFVPTDELEALFGDCGKLKTVSEDGKGNIWYLSDLETGVTRQNEDLTYTKITAPFSSLRGLFVNAFEFIYPYDEENVFFGLEDGFVHYSPSLTRSYNKPFQSYIFKIELPYIDSVVYHRVKEQKLEYEFPFRKNILRFDFASPFFANSTPLKFSYYLDGFSDEWSAWSDELYVDFTNLREGDYQFQLKAKNIYGVESDVSTFSFSILPPWHRSALAYFIYVLIVSLLAFFVVRYILFRIDRSKRKEELRHEQEMQTREEQFHRESLIAEKKIVELRNDKLRSEMKHRDKELANQTMGIIKKNRFLTKVNEELNGIHDIINSAAAKTKILSLKKRIKKEIDSRQQSQIFETYFDEVHEEFFKRLKAQFPVLTPSDLRLCAFIKMNLTTQEIATILNISYRGTEISRYRLRKKLGLDRSTNLSVFLSNI